MAYENLTVENFCGIHGELTSSLIASTTIGYAPDLLSTSKCLHGRYTAINYTEMEYPPPNSLRLHDCYLPDNEMISLASNTKPELPVLSYPPGLNLLNPAWKSCSVDVDYLGMIDPPRTLDKATAMAPSSTPSAAPASSAVPDQASATPAPSSKIQSSPNDPAQPTSALTPVQSAAPDSALHASSIDTPSKDPTNLNSDPLSQSPGGYISSNRDLGSPTGSSPTDDVASLAQSDHVKPQMSPKPSDSDVAESGSEPRSQSAPTISSQQLPASKAIEAASQTSDPTLGGIIASALGHAPDAAVNPPGSSIQGADSASELLFSSARPSSTSISQVLQVIPTQALAEGSIIKAEGPEATPADNHVGLKSSGGIVLGESILPTSVTVSDDVLASASFAIPADQIATVTRNPASGSLPAQSPVYTIADQVITVNPTAVLVAGQRLTPGSSGTIIAGTSVILGSSGDLIIGQKTIPLSRMAAPMESVTSAQVFTVGTQLITAPHSVSALSVASATVLAGGSIVATLAVTQESPTSSAQIFTDEMEPFSISVSVSATSRVSGTAMTDGSAIAANSLETSESGHIGSSNSGIPAVSFSPTVSIETPTGSESSPTKTPESTQSGTSLVGVSGTVSKGSARQSGQSTAHVRNNASGRCGNDLSIAVGIATVILFIMSVHS